LNNFKTNLLRKGNNEPLKDKWWELFIGNIGFNPNTFKVKVEGWLCEINYELKGLKDKGKGGLSLLFFCKNKVKKSTIGNYRAVRLSSNYKNEGFPKDSVPVFRRFEVGGLYWMPRKSPWPLLAAITIFCMA